MQTTIMEHPAAERKRVAGVYTLAPGSEPGTCTVRLICPACCGGGEIEGPRPQVHGLPINPPEGEWTQCHVCFGSGRIDAIACLHCLCPSLGAMQEHQPELAEAWKAAPRWTIATCDGYPFGCAGRLDVVNPPLVMNEDEYRMAVDALCDAVADPEFDKPLVKLLHRLDPEAATRVRKRFGRTDDPDF